LSSTKCGVNRSRNSANRGKARCRSFGVIGSLHAGEKAVRSDLEYLPVYPNSTCGDRPISLRCTTKPPELASQPERDSVVIAAAPAVAQTPEPIRSQAAAGPQEVVSRLIAAALEEAQRITDSKEKVAAYGRIAAVQIRANNAAAARRTLILAGISDTEVVTDSLQALVCNEVAVAYAETGDLASARQTLLHIGSGLPRDSAVAAIAAAEAQAGDVQHAYAMIEGLDREGDRSLAYLEVEGSGKGGGYRRGQTNHREDSF
jgi:hypothetical protein